MNILSVGGGAREHAIVKALLKSDNIVLYSAMKNRNPGIAKASKEFLLVNEIETDKIADWAERNKIDLAVIGPEAPLGEGIVDALEKKGIRTVGPTKRASQIEISKQYMRALMKKHDLPGRVDYEVFDNIARLKDFMNEYQKEVVVKPVGLTGGKGVKIMGEHLNDKKDVIEYSKQIIENKIGGAAKVILEEKLLGEEFTFQVFCDGKNIVPMPVVQDHKRAYEGDVGPNTGGMGSYSCADHLLPFLEKKEYEGSLRIIQKTIDVHAHSSRTKDHRV
jgi:phosphoribosylamine--glycine ligase